MDLIVSNLVEIAKGQALTTSLRVAEVFGKQHKNVIQKIRSIECSEQFNRLNFKPVEYTDEKGEQRPMFVMTKDGFTMLAMGFTGQKAAEWREKYISAFNQMEKALLQKENLSWQAARQENKTARRLETDAIQHFVNYAAGQGSSNARTYYMTLTTMTHRALFLVKAASPKPFRDMLDAMQLSFLTAAEYITQEALRDGMAQGLHYKDIYKLARERVEAYSATLPKTRLLIQ